MRGGLGEIYFRLKQVLMKMIAVLIVTITRSFDGIRSKKVKM